MKKKFTKDEWTRLLQRDLIKMPEHDREHIHEYITPDNLIITITTKTKIRRNYTFGGPIWCAEIDFAGKDKLGVDFFSPLRKPYNIAWAKVNEITFHFISI